MIPGKGPAGVLTAAMAACPGESVANGTFLDVIGLVKTNLRTCRSWRQFARDLLACVTRVRPVFMVDYVHLRRDQVVTLLRAAASLTGVRLLALRFGDCCWFVANTAELGSMINTCVELGTFPQFIAFERVAGRGLLVPKVATTPEVQCIRDQLRSTCRCLASDLEASTSASVDAIDISSFCEDAFFPTLSGWLLGYPAVYVLLAPGLPAHDPQEVSRALSCAELVLFQCRVTCGALGENRPPVRKKEPHAHDPDVLLAFTVPSMVLSDGAAQAMTVSLEQAVADRICNAPYGVWGKATVSTEIKENVGVAL
ncbi:unnamed protein product [Ostreobium quekettii]|uniref:Uncharacterized protein n=1 Tax=Ostreobium quekettii TaxID=121088 RepID=A0A8S1JBQ5_9CHLO|nr:unnamed protein product [Ostreobium quekettii]|eukprot:evm.model.scf_3255.2 EVM.evm.TU.scf_3255.2   scf_3255:12896-13831(+)